MKPTPEYAAIRRGELVRLQITACVGALAAAILLTVAIELWRPILFPPAAAAPSDPAMETACKFPRLEGAMTVVTVLDGKLICWRWA